jgi:chitodextrinase
LKVTTKGYIEVWWDTPASYVFISRHRDEVEALESATEHALTQAGEQTYELRYPNKLVKAYGILNPRADTVAPTVPGSLSATSLSTTSIGLAWSLSTDAVGVSGYQVWRDGVPRTTTTALTYTDTGLTPTTLYSYRVSAFDEAGNMSGLSNIATATTQTPAVNLPPVWQTIAQQELTTGASYSLNLTSLVSDPEGQAVAVAQFAGTLPTGVTYNSSTKIISGTPTVVGSTSVTFRATDAGAVVADRIIVFNVLAADATAPSVPVLTATAVSTSRIDLSWSASTDTAGTNERSSGLHQYRLFRDGLFRQAINEPTVEFSDTGLSAGTSYSYTIRAIDVAGNLSDFSNAAAATTQSTPAPSRMYPAGHWTIFQAALRNNQWRNSAANRIVRSADGQTVITKGFWKRYSWRQLEPTQGAYSFITNPTTDELRLDLAWAATNGVKLVPMITTRAFGTGVSEAPAYLDPYVVTGNDGHRFTALWDPYVQTRYNALIKAIGDTFDGTTAFAGTATGETAMDSADATDAMLGIGGPVPTGKLYVPYTVARARDGFISIILNAWAELPTTRFYWMTNFHRGDQDGSTIADVINAVVTAGKQGVLVLCGPDLLPGLPSLETRFYPYFDQFKDTIPLCLHCQNDSYSHPLTGLPEDDDTPPFYTPTQLIDSGIANQHLNFIVWTYLANPQVTGGYSYTDAITAMRARPTFNVESW